MRSFAPPPQPRLVLPSVVGTEPASVSGDFQSLSAAPVVASAVPISHGLGRGGSRESGATPVPRRPAKANPLPFRDQRGERVPATVRAGHVGRVASVVFT